MNQYPHTDRPQGIHAFTNILPGRCVNCGQGFTLLSTRCGAKQGQYAALQALPHADHQEAAEAVVEDPGTDPNLLAVLEDEGYGTTGAV